MLERLLTSVYMPSNLAQGACGNQICDADTLNANLGSNRYSTTFGTATNGAPGGGALGTKPSKKRSL